jgi:rfaE bifunctional protein nucleotidyltransferase chain/domain
MTATIVPDYHELVERLAPLRQGRSLALTNGCFDLLHVGHVRLLSAASTQAELLVVALNTDESVHQTKGEGRPLVPLEERMEIIAAIEGVDFVTSFPETLANDLIDALRPDVHVKGTDWTEDTVPEREIVTAYGGRIAICGDEKRHSSTEIIKRR